jgi:hypothetical protein
MSASRAGDARAFDPVAARDYFIGYYDLVDERSYTQSWAMLTERFRRERAHGYASYTHFWNGVRSATVRGVDIVDNATWPVTVDAAMRYVLADGRVSDETARMTLVHEGRAILIDTYETVTATTR